MRVSHYVSHACVQVLAPAIYQALKKDKLVK